MKTEFELTLFDDEATAKRLTILNKLEAMFDDPRNVIPESYFYFSDKIPVGSTIRVTFEVI
jgi:hypothetical protein